MTLNVFKYYSKFTSFQMLFTIVYVICVTCVPFTGVMANSTETTLELKVKNNRSQCTRKAYNEVDEIVARMTEMNDKNRFPESVEELLKRCERRSGLLKKIEDLKNKCMDGMVKRVVSILVYSMRRQRKSLCRSKATKKMTEFVSAGRCINTGREGAQLCVQEALEHVVGIRRVDHKKKVPMICCTFVKLKTCLIANANKNKQCSEENIQLLVRQSEQISSGPMNMACGDYNEETDRCGKLELPMRGKDEPLPKSFLMPLIELFESFSPE